MSLPNDSIKKILIVSVGLCVVCSVLVSAATVALRPQQVKNAVNDRRKNVLVAAGLVDRQQSDVDIDAFFKSIETRLVDLASGEPVEDPPANFDFEGAMKDPARSEPIPPDLDTGGIKARPRRAEVYMVKKDGALDCVVLPIVGKGLWSTMWGYVALEKDLVTIRGLVFYDQKETPGLGGEVDNPKWRGQFPGKQLFDPDGDYHFKVLKGQVPESSDEKEHLADGLSGATITARGVSGTLRYWMGPHGYGPLLDRLGGRNDG